MTENKIDEQDVFNFALNLDYLKAESYTYATTGNSITSFGIGIKGPANGVQRLRPMRFRQGNPTSGGATVEANRSPFPTTSSSLAISRRDRRE
jgi:hypothetical protein